MAVPYLEQNLGNVTCMCIVKNEEKSENVSLYTAYNNNYRVWQWNDIVEERKGLNRNKEVVDIVEPKFNEVNDIGEIKSMCTGFLGSVLIIAGNGIEIVQLKTINKKIENRTILLKSAFEVTTNVEFEKISCPDDETVIAQSEAQGEAQGENIYVWTCQAEEWNLKKYEGSCCCKFGSYIAVAQKKKVFLYPSNQVISTDINDPITMCASVDNTKLIIASGTGVSLVNLKEKHKLRVRYEYKDNNQYKDYIEGIKFVDVTEDGKYIVATSNSEVLIWNTMENNDDDQLTEDGKDDYYGLMSTPYFGNKIPRQKFDVRSETSIVIDKYLLTTAKKKGKIWLLDNNTYYNNDGIKYEKISYSEKEHPQVFPSRSCIEKIDRYKWDWDNGIIYKYELYYGEMKDGLRHTDQNYGCYTKDNTYYYGEWKEDKKHGFGIEKNDDQYTLGKWNNGKLKSGNIFKLNRNYNWYKQKYNLEQTSYEWQTPMIYKSHLNITTGYCNFQNNNEVTMIITYDGGDGGHSIEGQFHEKDSFRIISSNEKRWIWNINTCEFYTGLKNENGICWANTGIQILKNLPNIGEVMMRIERFLKPESNQSDSEKRVHGMINIIRKMQFGYIESKEENKEFKVEWNPYEQNNNIVTITEDNNSKPFQSIIDYHKLFKKKNPEQSNQDTGEFLNKFFGDVDDITDKSRIMRRYMYTICEERRCNGCEAYQTPKRESNYILNITLNCELTPTEAEFLNKNDKKIDDYINNYFEPDAETSGDTKCQSCGKRHPFSLKSSFTELPQILIVYLKAHFVSVVNEEITITDVRKHGYQVKISEKSIIQDAEYELITVGYSNNIHWTCACKTDNKWLYYNDATYYFVDKGINEFSEDENMTPCILVYKKIS